MADTVRPRASGALRAEIPGTHFEAPSLGRAVVEGKRGSIPENLPSILDRLKIDPAAYVRFINRSEKSRFGNFIGPIEAMRNLAERFGKSFLKGQAAAA